ncbi:hypothetical protein GKQ23_13575 [Erwinia sp. E602]|uniref:hypothetical protein n=1 Tax=Erwinia sp. E602 TaxID=2675378 RepID=UPI001BA5B229|nr:hypothetical protein [Erwinia sp. E602]QUG75961.1 hypothetical protein GKQ23_13575 [Erwinia sp. E602]
MKSQMQIVQEAIERLEKMNREEFVQTLVSAGLADPEPVQHEIFHRTMTVADVVEVGFIPDVQELSLCKSHTGCVLTFAF